MVAPLIQLALGIALCIWCMGGADAAREAVHRRLPVTRNWF